MEARSYNNNRTLRRAMFRLSALSVLCLALFAFWQFSPLGTWSEPGRLSQILEAVDRSPWAGPIVVAAFVLGSFVVFPVTALIAAAGIALGPADGLLWASIGSMLAAVVTYGLARALPEPVLDEWIGPWVRVMGKRIRNGGIVSMMVARNIPVAPFTLVNVVAGAARIRFLDYLVGTILGMGPMLAALTILGDRLRGAWEAPTGMNLLLLGTAIALWVAIAFVLQSLSNRLASGR